MSIVHICMCTRHVFGPHVGNQTSGIVISNGFELLCGCSETNIDQEKTILQFSLIIAKNGYHQVIRNNNSSNCSQG